MSRSSTTVPPDRRAVPHLDPVLRHEPWGERSVRLTDPNGIAVRLVEWVPPAGSEPTDGTRSAGFQIPG